GVVCPCMGTTVDDLTAAFDKGYTDLELMKRASWAGLGPCQGGACLPHVRAFLAAKTGTIPDPFTARPAARQVTLAEAAADVAIDAFRRTPLHEEHLAIGARMDRFGGWWRPWHYGDAVAEHWAVRDGGEIGGVRPGATPLLSRLGLAAPPRFLGHVRAEIAGVPCHVMRLSFTGEAAFELHHPLDGSVALWRALLDRGADLGIRPHGLQALFGLRLEKGHVIVGMDTELDTTPRRLGMDWAVRMEKPAFIGRASLERTA